MDLDSKPIKLKRPVYFVGEGYYHVVDTKQAVFGNFHHFGYIEHVVMSYVEQTEVTTPLVILQETRYPYDNYIEKLDEMLSSYKIIVPMRFFIYLPNNNQDQQLIHSGFLTCFKSLKSLQITLSI